MPRFIGKVGRETNLISKHRAKKLSHGGPRIKRREFAIAAKALNMNIIVISEGHGGKIAAIKFSNATKTKGNEAYIVQDGDNFVPNANRLTGRSIVNVAGMVTYEQIKA